MSSLAKTNFWRPYEYRLVLVLEQHLCYNHSMTTHTPLYQTMMDLANTRDEVTSALAQVSEPLITAVNNVRQKCISTFIGDKQQRFADFSFASKILDTFKVFYDSELSAVEVQTVFAQPDNPNRDSVGFLLRTSSGSASYFTIPYCYAPEGVLNEEEYSKYLYMDMSDKWITHVMPAWAEKLRREESSIREHAAVMQSRIDDCNAQLAQLKTLNDFY